MSDNPIDLNALNELKEIMGDEFSELITVFITDGQTQLDNLNTAITDLNAPDVRRFAHTLKGSSANLGIENLSAICKKLELKAADNMLDDADSLLKTMSDEFLQVKAALEEFI